MHSTGWAHSTSARRRLRPRDQSRRGAMGTRAVLREVRSGVAKVGPKPHPDTGPDRSGHRCADGLAAARHQGARVVREELSRAVGRRAAAASIRQLRRHLLRFRQLCWWICALGPPPICKPHGWSIRRDRLWVPRMGGRAVEQEIDEAFGQVVVDRLAGEEESAMQRRPQHLQQ